MAPKKANVAGASAGIVPDFACSTKHNGLEWTGTFDLGRFFHAASGRAWLDLRPSVELRDGVRSRQCSISRLLALLG
jgi:hypothetical protein